jgi:hypothetical protein
MALVFFFLLKVFYDLTVSVWVKYLYLKIPRKVSNISRIIME